MPVAPASAAFDTCTYAAGTKTVTATLTTATAGELSRNVAGAILANGVQCGTATVTNTDKIVVSGDGSTDEEVTVRLENGGFTPGATDETGTSDEIEISVELGGGNDQVMHVLGSQGADSIAVGGMGAGSGIARAANLNANESSGIDVDLTVPSGSFARTRVDTLAGNDTLSDNGGPGLVHGGASQLQGGAGNDVHTVSGAAFGGPGDDHFDFPTDVGGTMSYATATGPVTVLLSSASGGGTAAGGDGSGGTDTYTGKISVLMLGPFGDHFTASGTGRGVVHGAGGNDELQGGTNQDALRGDDGNDTLRGGGGNDSLEGHDGDDHLHGEDGGDMLEGHAGADTADGGGGDDFIPQSRNEIHADAMFGGTGYDIVYYASVRCPIPGSNFFGFGAPRTAAVTVDLDGVADDGAPGEGDNVAADVEDVVGTQHDDTLVGSDGDDVLSGLGGRDVLRGGGGDDRLEGLRAPCNPDVHDLETIIGDTGDDLDGGPGADIVNASLGDDVVVSRDPFADTVDCGDGEDTLTSDLLDAWSNCESVNAAAPPAEEPPPEPTPTATPAPTAAPPPVLKPPPAVVAPALPSVTSLIERPAAKRCVSRRRLRLKVKKALRDQVASVTVFVNGKRKTRVSGGKLALPVDLRGLPKGRFTVRLEIALKDGRTAEDTRRYRTCAPRKRA